MGLARISLRGSVQQLWVKIRANSTAFASLASAGSLMNGATLGERSSRKEVEM